MADEVRADTTNIISRWWLFIVVGVLFVVLGVFAIASPFIAGLAIALAVGWIFLFAGILHIVQAFWNIGRTSFWLSLLIGILYFLVGLALLAYPMATLISLTLLLGAFFLVQGVLTLVLAFQGWVHNKGWVVLSGIITLLLALIILSQWPTAAAWVIGTIVGVELIFRGVSLMSLGFALHSGRQFGPMRLAGGHI